MAITVLESLSFEDLWDRFSTVLEAPLQKTLASEIIVIPAGGWASFFNRRLAARCGCWAQYNFVTLGQWVNQTLEQVLGAENALSRDSDILTWRVAARLPALLSDEDFAPVRHYIQQKEGTEDPYRLLDLSRCIAGLFDQYILNRPELIASWSSAEAKARQAKTGSLSSSSVQARWQRKIWRAINDAGDPSVAKISYRSMDRILDDLANTIEQKKDNLPERVSVWLCGTVPPAYLKYLDIMGRHIRIGLYLVSPTYPSWGDAPRRRELLKKFRESASSVSEFCAAEKLEALHPLLVSMGEWSRQRQMLMTDYADAPWTYEELSSSKLSSSTKAKETPRKKEGSKKSRPESLSLLASVRQALEGGRMDDSAPVEFLKEDVSLQLHNCHSPLREVEVLRDQLRAALRQDSTLQPEDIAILCPDPETYAPIIQAVFSHPAPGQPGHIPVRISGRSPRRTRPVIDAYFKLLNVLQGRFGQSEVMDLLNIDVIRKSTALRADDIENLSQWITDSGIRWGADGAHRHEEKLPKTDLNTWAFGFDRLLLGYAMPPGGGQLVGEALALDRSEGLQAAGLGQVWEFVERLKHWREKVQQPASLGSWQEALAGLAKAFLSDESDETGSQIILDAIDQLARQSGEHGFVAALPFPLVVRELQRQVDKRATGMSFRLGGVTVGEISGMRSLPFKVIALLGINDGAFPRMDRPVSFDLMALESRLGDRKLRLEDKHLFLESMISAQSRLIITYQGQSQRDARERPPSVVLEELIDCLSAHRDRATVKAALTIKHPLQPFSPEYFKGQEGGLFSFDKKHFETATALLSESKALRVFAHSVLPAEEDLEELQIQELRQVVEKPWTIFLKRLGVRMFDDTGSVEDREPLWLNALEQWKLGDAWLQDRLSDTLQPRLTDKLLRSGNLPSGDLGAEFLKGVRQQAEQVVLVARREGLTAEAQSLPIRLMLDGVSVQGVLSGRTPAGLRLAMYSKIKPKYILRHWIDHLLLCASGGEGGHESILIGRGDGKTRMVYHPVDQDVAHTQLVSLIKLYRLALRMPLPFFPDTLDKTLARMRKPGINFEEQMQVDDVLAEAREAYEAVSNGKALANEPSVHMAFCGQDPFATRCSDVPGLNANAESNLFAYLVETLCTEMIHHTEKR